MTKRIMIPGIAVCSISFEGIGDEPFFNNSAFIRTFIELCADALRFTKINEKALGSWSNTDDFDEEKPFRWLGKKISSLCKEYEVILMVDEVDKCSENQVFLNFLGMLCEKYLA